MKHRLFFLLLFIVNFAQAQVDSIVTAPVKFSSDTITTYGIVYTFPVPTVDKRFNIQPVPGKIEIRELILDRSHRLYEQYKLGKIDVDSFKLLIERLNIDTSNLYKWKDYDKLYILVKYKGDSLYEVTPDVNRSFSFTDDRVYKVRSEETIQFTYNVKYWDKKELKRKLVIDFCPYMKKLPELPGYENYFKATGGTKKLTLGTINLGIDSFRFIVWHPDYSIGVTKEKAKMIFFSKTNENDVDMSSGSSIYYSLSDTIYAGDHLLQFKEMNFTGDTISFRYFGINEEHRGPTVGMSLRSLIGKDLITGTEIDLSFKNTATYTLLHFWGSWCDPCIKNLPLLSKLIKEYQGRIAVYGFPYESREDISKARGYIIKDELKWPQLLQYRNHPLYGADVVNVLKVKAFPTYILLNKQGVIVVRSTSLSDVEAALKAMR